ncbi:hypothetical protein [Arthrobacter sp. D1-17]
MTNTSATPQRRPLAKLALVSVASLGLIGGSVAVAGPASAGGYDYKEREKKVECWVDAKKVDHKENYGHYSDNRKKRDKADVKFEFKVWCDKKTDVKFEHWIFQKRPNGKWVLIKHKDGKIDNVNKEGVRKHTKAEVKDLGRKGGEEKVFHVVKIKFHTGKHHVTKADHEYGTVDFGRRY